MNNFPYISQLDSIDCGPTCLRMVAKNYGKRYSLERLREVSHISREGVSMLGLAEAAENIGFHTICIKVSFEKLLEAPLPCILHWNQNHFVILYKISDRNRKFHIADPAGGKYTLGMGGLLKCWASTENQGQKVGTALLLEPSPDFYTQNIENEKNEKKISFFFSYLKPFKRQFFHLFLGLVISSFLSLIFPFLTQSIVDQGIARRNLSFITLVLIAQLVLFCTQLTVNFLQSWISLHINTRISISLISDFLSKLMKLPLYFFDSKNVGDIMQRIGDNERIKSFLTGSSITTLFSFFNFIIFACILAYYNLIILTVFLIGVPNVRQDLNRQALKT